MPIIATPENATELTQLRTLRGKVFQLANGKRRLIAQQSPIHYLNDSNQLDDIETDIEDEAGTGEKIAHRLPFRFRLRNTGVGFDYQSKADGLIVRKALTRVGATNIDQNGSYSFTRSGNRIRFVNVATDLDIMFVVKRSGVQTFWIPKSANAARSVRWAIEYDLEARNKIADVIRGRDNLGNTPRPGLNRRPLNVSFSDGIATLQASGRWRFIRTETWTGETEVRDPDTRIPSWSTDVLYPVAIDPDIVEDIAATGDDGHQNAAGTTWDARGAYSSIVLGKNYSARYNAGFRFTGVVIDQGVTIDLAVLKVNRVSGGGVPGGGGGTIYGYDVDSAGAWTSSTAVPSNVAKTTASANWPRQTTNGVKSMTVTSIVQELVDRAGWSSGGNMAFPVINYESGSVAYSFFEDLSFASTDEAQLEIDYTAGGGGGSTAGNLLLLGAG